MPAGILVSTPSQFPQNRQVSEPKAGYVLETLMTAT